MTILCCGEPLIVLTPTGGGSLVSATECHLGEGGAELNVAVHLARLGLPVRYAGAVGDDPFGLRLREMLAEEGVDASGLVTDAQRPTAVYFKEPNGLGTRMLYYRDESAGSRYAQIAEDVLEGVDHIHLTGISPALSSPMRALVEDLLAQRRDEPHLSVPSGRRVRQISFDVNYRRALWSPEVAGPVLLDLAGSADVVFVGRDEAEIIWGTRDSFAIRALLPEVDEIVVKGGDEPADVWCEGRWICASPESVTVVEPVGAGDAFAAAYVGARRRGADAMAAAEAGHRLAGHVIGSASDQGVRGDRVYVELGSGARAH